MPEPKIGGLELLGNVGANKIVLLIDPGVTKFFISEKILKDLKMEPNKMIKPEKTQIASGKIEIIDKRITLEISL